MSEDNLTIEGITQTFIERPELKAFFQAFFDLSDDTQKKILDAFTEGGGTFEAFMAALYKVKETT